MRAVAMWMHGETTPFKQRSCTIKLQTGKKIVFKLKRIKTSMIKIKNYYFLNNTNETYIESCQKRDSLTFKYILN